MNKEACQQVLTGFLGVGNIPSCLGRRLDPWLPCAGLHAAAMADGWPCGLRTGRSTSVSRKLVSMLEKMRASEPCLPEGVCRKAARGPPVSGHGVRIMTRHIASYCRRENQCAESSDWRGNDQRHTPSHQSGEDSVATAFFRVRDGQGAHRGEGAAVNNGA